MAVLELSLAVVAGLVLFLYGIENFSRQVQRSSSEKFRDMLTKLTKTPIRGALFGAVITAILQSSSATTVITVGLVNSGTISFAQSLGMIIGANIGTTITGQLIAFKLTKYASLFMVVGFISGVVSKKYRMFSKTLFYFGLLFFGLNIISGAVEPIKEDPQIVELFGKITGLPLTLAAGALFTAIVQSSSVTTGIVVILAQSGLFTLQQGFPILLGSNIGTTVTSMLASLKLSLHSKRAAVAHLLFNIGGVMLVLPFIGFMVKFIQVIGGSTSQQIANAHTLFNVGAGVIFIILIKPFKKLVLKIVPGEEEEILFKTKYLEDELPEDNNKAYKQIENELKYAFEVTHKIYKESITILETADTDLYKNVVKLEDLNDYLDEKIEDALLSLSERQLGEKEVEQITLLIRLSHALEQFGDAAKDLGKYTKNQIESGIKPPRDTKRGIKKVYDGFERKLSLLSQDYPLLTEENNAKLKKASSELRETISSRYKEHMGRLKNKDKKPELMFVEYIAIMESAISKLREIRKLCKLYTKTQSKKDGHI